MMACPAPQNNGSVQLEALAEQIFVSLAAQFPVCLSSDEFHYFPQYRPPHPDWSRWDDFSSAAVEQFLSQASRWCQALEGFRTRHPYSAGNVDVDLLQKTLITLQEQIGRVCAHQNQPTFYLSIISIGLSEALETSNDAFDRRLMSLPDFIQTAIVNLKRVPAVFRDLGLEMIGRIRAWLEKLPLSVDAQGSVMAAMDSFHRHLTAVEITGHFHLRPDLYARIAEHHMGCQMGLEEIAWHLDQEIEEAAHQLIQSATRISPGKPWQSVFHDRPAPKAAGDDAAGHYRDIVFRLKAHCLDHGFVDQAAMAGCDVEIQTIPEHLMPIRANAAYSMPPGHPPRGGVFYILPCQGATLPRDMMLLAAHETFPGHHLLDTLRWGLGRPLRRCLEFPVFYEGWASFGEEILFDTEFFSGPVDRLLMAKRRFWRAHRGRADLRIHTGRWRLDEAAAALAEIGLVSRDQARAMVRRYALKPGYQLAYAIGRRKFRQLYTAFLGRGHTPAQFVRQVLSQGEIGFDHLAEKLLYGGGSG